MNNQAILPRRSRRLATFIPASHWINIGYSEDDAQAMEKLQKDMKKYYDGSDETTINIEGSNPGVSLRHHDMMLPHWQKLFKAHGRTLECIQIFEVIMSKSVLDIMFPTMQSVDLKTLTFYNVELGNDGFLKLSSFLKENTTLKELAVGTDHLDNTSVASALSDAIKNHPTLEQLFISELDLSNIILRKVLEGCTRLIHLGLMDNLGAATVGVLADFIRSNHPIQRIMMKQCNISDNDIVVLASALKINTHLDNLLIDNGSRSSGSEQFSLDNNDITEAGEKHLLKALFDPRTMDSIVESNHTCMAYSYDIRNSSIVTQRPRIETEVLNINGDKDISIQQKIRKKVVLALCEVDGGLFDLSHLNDLPLQLMPQVLELIQSRTKAVNSMPNQLEKDALSRLFHTLRGWELPLLFENLRVSSVATGKRKRKARGIGKRSCRR
jgi:hypothetical protein